MLGVLVIGGLGTALIVLAQRSAKSPAVRERQLRAVLSDAVQRKLTFEEVSLRAQRIGFKSVGANRHELEIGTEIIFYGPENPLAAEQTVLRGMIEYRAGLPVRYKVFWTKTVFAL